MRTIYIRMDKPENFTGRVLASDTSRQLMELYGINGIRWTIYNKDDLNKIIMLEPKLRRRIVKGITIVEKWGVTEKWFNDTDSDDRPLWGSR